MPKIVLSGTAITATSSESQNALTAAGVVIQFQAAPKPCSKVLPNTTATGSSRSSGEVQQGERAEPDPGGAASAQRVLRAGG